MEIRRLIRCLSQCFCKTGLRWISINIYWVVSRLQWERLRVRGRPGKSSPSTYKITPRQALFARLPLVKWSRGNGRKLGDRAQDTQSAKHNPRYQGGVTDVTGGSAGGAVSEVTKFLASSHQGWMLSKSWTTRELNNFSLSVFITDMPLSPRPAPTCLLYFCVETEWI